MTRSGGGGKWHPLWTHLSCHHFCSDSAESIFGTDPDGHMNLQGRRFVIFHRSSTYSMHRITYPWFIGREYKTHSVSKADIVQYSRVSLTRLALLVPSCRLGCLCAVLQLLLYFHDYSTLSFTWLTLLSCPQAVSEQWVDQFTPMEKDFENAKAAVEVKKKKKNHIACSSTECFSKPWPALIKRNVGDVAGPYRAACGPTTP